jgi:flagellar motor switch protein FliN/FliY
MSHDVDFEPLSGDAGDAPARTETFTDLRRLSAVPVDLSVEIGRARMSVGETLELREGSVVPLDRMAGEPVDLLVNGTPIARGEVVLRLTQVLNAAPGSEPAAAAAAAAAAEPEPAAPVPAPEPVAG